MPGPTRRKSAHWFPDRAEGKAEPGATITWIFDKFDCRIPAGRNPRIVEVRGTDSKSIHGSPGLRNRFQLFGCTQSLPNRPSAKLSLLP
jgi:hypothetical protein